MSSPCWTVGEPHPSVRGRFHLSHRRASTMDLDATVRFAPRSCPSELRWRILGEPIEKWPVTPLLESTSCGNRPVRRANSLRKFDDLRRPLIALRRTLPFSCPLLDVRPLGCEISDGGSCGLLSDGTQERRGNSNLMRKAGSAALRKTGDSQARSGLRPSCRGTRDRVLAP
jgi:hypothetical protein